MGKNDKFNYKKAEADLDSVGARHPDRIYEYRSDKSLRGIMKENGLNPDKYYKSDNKNNSSGNSGGCYLTTACVEAKGLPDDCTELQTLRAFRDGYLAGQPNGKAEIEAYYKMAPGIVEAINQKANAKEIWNDVYNELVEPCVNMIHHNENKSAYNLYKSYSLQLNQKFQA